MKIKKLALTLSLLTSGSSFAAINTTLGTANIDLRLRYEHVSQNNALENANALALRTKANFKSKNKQGFYGFVEVENSIALVDNYNDTLGNGTEYSVIADPTTTELDQLYLGYQQDDVQIKAGRQVITFDNHRFVGHVAWRNDKQTYDALTAKYSATKNLTLSYAYIDKRNRIFANDKDIDSKDHLLNIGYKTSLGKLSGYGYFLAEDESGLTIDTHGLRFQGKQEKLHYLVEFANQTKTTSDNDFDSYYLHLQTGYSFTAVTIKAGFELLSSDHGEAAFITPLATLHKFNGWADQFLATPNVGLRDFYTSASGKAAGGKWSVIYHHYKADEASMTVDDLGSEINLVYSTKINDFPVGIKYANYSSGDIKVDTDKLWIWTGISF